MADALEGLEMIAARALGDLRNQPCLADVAWS